MKILKTITTTTSGILMLLAAVFSLNFIASKLQVRLDLTQDKVFSLSEGTRNILGKLDRDVTIKLYFSRSLKDLPVQVKTYATRVEELLQEYKSASKGKVNVEVIDPKPDSDEEEWAQKYGITGVRLAKGDQMFFGLVFLFGAQEVTIPYLDPRREEFLEYDIAEALVSKMKKETVKVGILSSFPVIGTPNPMMGPQGDETWAFVNDLRRNFKVEKLDVDMKDVPSDMRVIIVLHPKDLSEPTQYALDQFVLNGGRLIVAVDPMSRTDLQLNGNAARAAGQQPTMSSDLNKLLTNWDIDYDKSNMVGDASLATQINAGGQMIRYPFFMTVGEANFAKQSVITGKLKSMMIAEGGVVSHKSGATSEFDPLITLSKDSATVGAAMAAFMNPIDLARNLKPDGKDRVIAAMVTGKFKTAFPGGGPNGAASSRKHKAEADADNSVVVITDVDLFADQNSVDKFRFGPQIMIRPRNDNLNFLVNAVDYLGGSEDLIAIRSKGRIARPFTRVADIQKNAQQRWQAEEQSLQSQINEVQQKLNQMQAQRTDGNKFVLNAEQQSEIARFREDERRVKKQLREVRKNLREDIEALGRKIVAVNMLFIPLATAGIGFGVFYRRNKKYRHEKLKQGDQKQ